MTKLYLDSFLNKIMGSKIEVYVMYLNLIPYLDLNLFPTVDKEFKRVSKYVDKIFKEWAHDSNVPFFSLRHVTSRFFENNDVFNVIIKNYGHPTYSTNIELEKNIRKWLVPKI